MIRNYIKLAWRNLVKHKMFSIINILGLAIGLACFAFIALYLSNELSYDRFHEKADRIYRIVSYAQEPEDSHKFAYSQYPLGPTVKNDFPEVEATVRFVSKERTLFKAGSNTFYETRIYFTDSTVFDIFSFTFLEGNPTTALAEPNTIVITASTAIKYFGKSSEAIGKTLQTAGNDVYKVTGVIADVPKNSHIGFDMLISATTLPVGFQDNWGSFNNYTYALLKPGVSPQSLSKKLETYYDKFMAVIFAPMNIKISYGVQPITSIHLHSDLEGEPEELGSMSYIWIFSTIAFFLLFIACINYMNLTTARSAKRAREIGIRKVSGSTRKQLVLQFLSESLLTAVVAGMLSIAIVILLLPMFNTLSGKAFSLRELVNPPSLLTLLMVIIITGLLGGSYPALYLSGFRPVSILKGSFSKAAGNISLRKALVVVQLSISIIMLICTWVVYAQLNFVRDKDLGFDKSEVMTLTVNTGQDERSKIAAMTNELRSQPGIQEVATAYGYPGSGNLNLNLYFVESKTGFINKAIETYSIDEYYLPTLNIQLAKGRNFSGLPDTLQSVLVNETLVKDFGWGEDALGKRIKFAGDTSGHYLEVVGVFRDFNQKSLYNPIVPLLLTYSTNCNIIQLKMQGNGIASALGDVESTWKSYFPQLPFEYTFLDADLNTQYAADQNRGKIFAIFSIITILITCLGLLGLTAFTAQQKQKEISLRRVLGASIPSVVTMIARNYLWLCLIAAIIAFPIAWYFMNNWLNLFSYHRALSFAPFLLSGLIIVCTAFSTSVFHSAKAAMANPSQILKTE